MSTRALPVFCFVSSTFLGRSSKSDKGERPPRVFEPDTAEVRGRGVLKFASDFDTEGTTKVELQDVDGVLGVYASYF